MVKTPSTGNEGFDVQIRRTLVPAIVAVVIAAGARAGLDLPADALVGILEAVIFGAYYTAIALLERKVPMAGILIGAIGRPSYPGPDLTIDEGEDDADA